MTFLSPKVKVTEVDLTTMIPAVATSIGVLVLRNTWKGPEMTQQLITTPGQLEQMFGYSKKKMYDTDGNYIKRSEYYEDFNNALGFLKFGSMLYCTRVMPDGAKFAGIINDGMEYKKFGEEGGQEALELNTETQLGSVTNPDEIADAESEPIPNMISDAGDDFWILSYSRGYHGNRTRVSIMDKDTQTNAPSGTTIEFFANAIDSPIEDDDDLLVIVESKEQGSRQFQVVEIHNVSLDEEKLDDQGRPKFIESSINQNSQYIRIAVNENQKNLETVPSSWVTEEPEEFGGGADYDEEDGTPSDASIIEGYDLYKNPEEIDVNLFIDSGKSETVKRRLVTLAQTIRGDSVAIVDVPYTAVRNNKGHEATDLVAWRRGSEDWGGSDTFNQNSSYVAAYANWLNVYDRYLKEYVWVPSSGYMAGIYAHTDDIRDAWWAPAGLNRAILTGVRKLAWNPAEGERDLLYMNGLNPIVSFSGMGKVVWGQKTLLNKASAFNRVNVRRLFLVIAKAVATSMKWFLFEMNDEFTRAQIVSMIRPYMADIKSRRGVYDFLVVCDERNNTPERIDRNELWLDIYIQPTRVAEFIHVRLIATRTGVSMEELVGSV